jgi:hypothetical protein
MLDLEFAVLQVEHHLLVAHAQRVLPVFGHSHNDQRKLSQCNKNGSDAISMMFTAAQVAPINLA